MSKLTFRDLFKRETLEREHTDSVPRFENELTLVNPLVQGKPFSGLELDHRLSDAPSAMIIFISLTCSSCIDLLSYLSAFEDKYNGFLLVISSGSIEENQELVNYYDYSFPVLTMEDKEYKARFGLEATPAAVFLEHGLVTKQFTIVDISHLYGESGMSKGGG